MKNTIAIGIPDKVSAAKRDGEKPCKCCSNHCDTNGCSNRVRHLTPIPTKPENKNVIEFDLPKGYKAEDAYWTGKSWITQLTAKEWSKDFRYINMTTLEEHFGIEVPDDDFDYGNFLLLLAAANGHKLE